MCGEIFFLFKVQGIYDSVSYINKTSEGPYAQQESDFILFSFRQIKEQQIDQRHYILMRFLLNLLGCVHLLIVKCWYCVDAPKQKAILQLQINKNE